jgi:hypothetical protein
MENYRLNLNNVTIVSINGRDPLSSTKAIEHSCKHIDFAAKLLLTNQELNHQDIKIVNAGNLSNLEDYNYFCVKKLNDYIETEYCLLVQPDGFVVNPYLWSEYFLQYDYIGAPWNEGLSQEVLRKCGMVSHSPTLIVGNGGFSLRSKKFLQECAKLEYKDLTLEEDCVVAVLNRSVLKNNGIKYAPVELARQFSLESPLDQRSVVGNSFGFHGKFYYFQNYLNITA